MNDGLIFSIIIFLCLLASVVSLVVLTILKLLEQEFDYLQMENKQIQLEKQVQQMEYIQLSQQIRPHFLLNSLNTMMSLARLERNNDLIFSMEKFSTFLKYQSKNKESLVSFESEINHTKNYLAMQKMRYGSKLDIEYQIEQAAYDSILPPYTLQTFVENAFKHGLDKKRGTKQLVIKLKRHGDWVILKVVDNGDSEPEHHRNTGMGLENVRKRFELIFDLYTEVSLKKSEKGTEVKAIWPYTPEGRI
ncbi:histidine kinase [Salinibacillus aidingensis]|uniref:Histidine kinase n=1 Tax=Salinibacillus aidingensis TaxID=237684 RepID=A0ABN1AY78_9BACI